LRVEDFEGPRYSRIDQIQQLLNIGQLDRTLRWQVPSPVPSRAN